MKLIHRYILQKLILPFLFGIILFSFVFLLDKFLDLNKLIISKHVNFALIIKLFFFYLPSVFSITIPLATFMAILIVLGRLKRDNELTAIFASGVSFTSFYWLLVMIGILMSLITLWINETIIPQANQVFRYIYSEIVTAPLHTGIKQKSFVKIKDFDIYIYNISSKNHLKGIYIYHPQKAIFAREGKLRKDLSKLIFFLKNGTIHQIDKKNATKYHLLQFSTHTIVISLKNKKLKKRKSIQEMNILELMKEINKYKNLQIDIFPIRIQLYKRISQPFACLALVLIGIPLGLLVRYRGKSLSLGISIIFIFIYYALSVITQMLCDDRILYPEIGMWLPNIIISITGIGLFMVRKCNILS